MYYYHPPQNVVITIRIIYTCELNVPILPATFVYALIDIVNFHLCSDDAAKRLDEDEQIFEESHRIVKEVQYYMKKRRLDKILITFKYCSGFVLCGSFV